MIKPNEETRRKATTAAHEFFGCSIKTNGDYSHSHICNRFSGLGCIRLTDKIARLLGEQGAATPNIIRMALRIVLNHVEPGFENSVALRLDGIVIEPADAQPPPQPSVSDEPCDHGMDLASSCSICRAY